MNILYSLFVFLGYYDYSYEYYEYSYEYCYEYSWFSPRICCFLLVKRIGMKLLNHMVDIHLTL